MPNAVEVSDQLSFLEDQVRRLNVELAKYQQNSSNAFKGTVSPEEVSIVPPWLIDSQYLGPLFRASDLHILELEDENANLKNEIKKLSTKAREVISENESLHKQIKTVFSQQSGSSPDSVTQEELQELAERTELLQEENDVLLEQQTITLQELDRMRTDLLNKTKDLARLGKELATLKNSSSTLQRERDSATNNLAILAAKLSSTEQENLVLSEQLNKKRADLATQTATSASLKHTYDELLGQRDTLINQSREWAAKEAAYNSTQLVHEQEIADLRTTVQGLMIDLETLKKDRDSIFESCMSLEQRLMESQSKETQFTQKLIQNAEEVSDMRLERDQSVMREQQLSKEVARLTERLQNLASELKEKHTNEMDSLRLQHKEQSDRLCEEIRQLEASHGQLKGLIDRSQRDVRTAEIELDRLRKDPSNEIERTQNTIDHIQNRCNALERERDDLVKKIDSLISNEQRERRTLEKERAGFSQREDEYQRRIKRIERDLQFAREDRLRALAQAEELQQQLRALTKEKEAFARKSQHEMEVISNDFQNQIRELLIQLEDTNEAHRRSQEQMQSLVEAQHHIRERWKEESKGITVRMEHILQDLRTENQDLRARVEDLTTKLNSAWIARDQISQQHQDVLHTLQRMRLVMEASEQKASDAVNSLTISMEREHALARENSDLVLQLEQIISEKRELMDSIVNGDADGSLKLQLDHANQAISLLQEKVSKLKGERQKLLGKLRSGVIDKATHQQHDFSRSQMRPNKSSIFIDSHSPVLR